MFTVINKTSLNLMFPLFIKNFSKLPTCSYSINKRSNETKKKVRLFMLDKFSDYLGKYEKILEKRIPTAMKVYRSFMDGVKLFYSDFKEFIGIFNEVNFQGKELKQFTLKQVELYDQMPGDILKVAPVLLFSTLPFTNYVILPLAYYFPRYLLTHHFWNLQQKSEFKEHLLRKRLLHNKPIFRHLQLQLPNLKNHLLYKQWSNVLGQIGSGVHPTVDQILECKDLFNGEPYHIYYISGNHVKHLVGLHDMFPRFLRRSRLIEKASLIQAMDSIILKEGVDKLPIDYLKQACFIRGLNPINVSEDEMRKWLSQWIEISKCVELENYSLLLHCPILLGYNQPSNWRIVYPDKVAT